MCSRMKKYIVFLFVLSFTASFAQVSVRFQPGEVIYVYETVPPGSAKTLYSGLIQNVAIVNTTAQDVTLADLNMRAYSSGMLLQAWSVGLGEIEQSAKQMHAYQGAGVLPLLEFQFQTETYLPDITFASGSTVKAGEAVVLQHKALLFEQLPGRLEVEVGFVPSSGKRQTSKSELRVENYQSKNTYQLPLQGRWFVAAAPTFVSHHRWVGHSGICF